MSLQLAAQHMASRGRGPDTMLVHMAPSEVKALQTVAKAHGGSLTINPDTGLPEAGFLSSILPMIAGVGLTAISGGTLTPVMAGLLTGGGTALATGNLQKGLMAGLGAYGGAGIGAGLAGAGAQEAILQANPGLTAAEIARSSVEPGFIQPSMTDKMLSGFKGLGSEAGRDAFMQSIGGAKGLFKSGASAALPVIMAGSGETASPPAESGRNPYEYDFTPGYTGPVRTPGGGTRFFDPRFVLRRAEGGETYADGGNTGMTGESDEYYRYLMGLAPMPTAYVAPVATPVNLGPPPEVVPQINSSPRVRQVTSFDGPGPDDPDNNPNSWGNLTPLEKAQFYSMNPVSQKVSSFLQDAFGRTIPGVIQNNFVPGFVQQQKDIVSGKMLNDYMKQYDYFGNPLTIPDIEAVMANAIEAQNNAAVTQADLDDAASGVAADVNAANEAGIAAGIDPGEFARGGLSSLAAFAQGGYNLGDYSDGGRLLRGPGDGVSDSIPASIGNKRPARLADGEFVVPARIVSELGNGSTEAGARKLYAMMDRVQKTRGKTTGKGRVAVNSRSDRYLPA